MKKSAIVVGSIFALAAIPVFAFSPVDPAKDLAAKINSNENLSVQFTAQTIGDAAKSFDVVFQKPNKAKIDTPEETIVADGENITVYVKSLKKFYKKPQTAQVLNGLMTGDELYVWTSFFNAKAFDKMTGKAAGTVNRKGKQYNVITVVMDASAGKTMTINIDPSTNLPAQAQIELKGKPNETIILNTTFVSTAVNNQTFAFKAPSGSEEIDEAQLVATNWMTYDQALTLAKATKKKVLVDFMADWCHWCHKLDDDVYSTAEFKEAAKDLILCKVDTDHEQEIAKRYNVGGIPDIRILDSEGNEIGKMVGYQPVQQFIQALKKFL